MGAFDAQTVRVVSGRHCCDDGWSGLEGSSATPSALVRDQGKSSCAPLPIHLFELRKLLRCYPLWGRLSLLYYSSFLMMNNSVRALWLRGNHGFSGCAE